KTILPAASPHRACNPAVRRRSCLQLCCVGSSIPEFNPFLLYFHGDAAKINGGPSSFVSTRIRSDELDRLKRKTQRHRKSPPDAFMEGITEFPCRTSLHARGR